MVFLPRFFTRQRVYLDYAASTPLDPAVRRVLLRALREFANAGAIHGEGRRAASLLSSARRTAAAAIGARPDEIIFTSGGTEANNLALLGVLGAAAQKRKRRALHLVTTAIEHSSVTACAEELARRGVAVTFVPPDARGIVGADAVLDAVRDETALISVMLVNNEIGAIEPVAEIGKALAERRRAGASAPFLHTDASQAPLVLDCRVARLHADLMTLDAQKTRGPKGVGLLYRRRGVPLNPILFGGKQEGGLRPGTENVPLAAAFAEALRLAVLTRKSRAERLSRLKGRFLAAVEKALPFAVVNGDPTRAAPHIVNLSFPGYDGEFLSVALDGEGIACSSKSACLGHGSEGSAVVREVSGEEAARSSLRFSLGDETTERDIDWAAAALTRVVRKFDKRKSP